MNNKNNNGVCNKYKNIFTKNIELIHTPQKVIFFIIVTVFICFSLITFYLLSGIHFSEYFLKNNIVKKKHIDKGKWIVIPAKLNNTMFRGSANLLKNGNVLIIGHTPSESNLAQIFNYKTNKIKTVNSPIYNRTIDFAAIELKDGKIYISGGCLFNSNAPLNCEMTNTTEIYNPLTDTFNEAAKMKYYKIGHKAILLKNGHVLILHTSNTSLDNPYNIDSSKLTNIKQEIYNPYTNKYYDTKNAIPPFFNNTIINLDNDNILILGVVGKNYIYNVNKNMFEDAYSNLNVRSDELVAQIDNNNILVINGCSSNNNGYIYNLKERSQKFVKNSMDITYCAGSRPNAVTLKNKNVLITGMDRNLNSTRKKNIAYQSYIYDFEKNEFIKICSPKYKVQDQSVVQLPDGNILYIGGQYFFQKLSNRLQLYRYN